MFFVWVQISKGIHFFIIQFTVDDLAGLLVWICLVALRVHVVIDGPVEVTDEELVQLVPVFRREWDVSQNSGRSLDGA